MRNFCIVVCVCVDTVGLIFCTAIFTGIILNPIKTAAAEKCDACFLLLNEKHIFKALIQAV